MAYSVRHLCDNNKKQEDTKGSVAWNPKVTHYKVCYVEKLCKEISVSVGSTQNL